MQRVRGIGGVFFKSADKQRLLAWYRDHLGIAVEDWGGVAFQWRREDDPEAGGSTVWSVFADDSDYFGDASARLMINYRVDDLDAMLAQLRAADVEVVDKIEESEFGKFGWAYDCDGNRFELWQPPTGM